MVVFRIGGWSPQIQTGYHVSRPTQDTTRLNQDFVYEAITLYSLPFQIILLSIIIPHCSPTTPDASIWFVLIRVRSPLLTESQLISLPLVTEMFHFTRLAPVGNIYRYILGCPIRKSMDQRFLASPHSLSQPSTSFIASISQGIHRLPLKA